MLAERPRQLDSRYSWLVPASSDAEAAGVYINQKGDDRFGLWVGVNPTLARTSSGGWDAFADSAHEWGCASSLDTQPRLCADWRCVSSLAPRSSLALLALTLRLLTRPTQRTALTDRGARAHLVYTRQEDIHIEIVNDAGYAADLSGWVLQHGQSTQHTFRPGTVLPAKSSLYLCAAMRCQQTLEREHGAPVFAQQCRRLASSLPHGA